MDLSPVDHSSSKPEYSKMSPVLLKIAVRRWAEFACCAAQGTSAAYRS